MKRLSLATIFACCTLIMAAQDAIQINYQGAKPTFSDFITAYLAPTYGEDGECDSEYMNGIRNAWERYRKGLKQYEHRGQERCVYDIGTGLASFMASVVPNVLLMSVSTYFVMRVSSLICGARGVRNVVLLFIYH